MVYCVFFFFFKLSSIVRLSSQLGPNLLLGPEFPFVLTDDPFVFFVHWCQISGIISLFSLSSTSKQSEISLADHLSIYFLDI